MREGQALTGRTAARPPRTASPRRPSRRCSRRPCTPAQRHAPTKYAFMRVTLAEHTRPTTTITCAQGSDRTSSCHAPHTQHPCRATCSINPWALTICRPILHPHGRATTAPARLLAGVGPSALVRGRPVIVPAHRINPAALALQDRCQTYSSLLAQRQRRRAAGGAARRDGGA